MKHATKKTLTRFLSTFMIALLIVANPGLTKPAGAQETEELDYNSLPPLLITEIVPDSSNVDSTDAYEYIEVYNNTDQPINFKDYQVILRYPTGPAEDQFWIPENREVVIPSGEALVLWVKPAKQSIVDLKVSDFNANYGVNLTDGVDIVDMPNSGAMHNQRLRDIVIKTNSGQEVVRAQYNKAEYDAAEDMAVIYKYPEDGSDMMQKVSSREEKGQPGTVKPENVPEQKVQVSPNVKSEIADETEASQPLDNVVVSAKVTDDFLLGTVTLHYRDAADANAGFTEANLEHPTEGVFNYTIPFQNMIGVDTVEYYLEVTNGLNTVESDKKEIAIQEAVSDDTPPLLITELVPQTSNIDGSNAYEYVEVYNNTDQPIDFGDFHISYRLPNGNTSKWFTNLENAVIEPGDNLVLWVGNGKNDDATHEMFKTNFGITQDINLILAPAGAGMANGGERDLVIVANTGEEIAKAGYNKPGNTNSDEVGVNTGIFYHYPIGSNDMVKLRTGLAATPGTVEEDLVPDELNKIDPEANTTIEDKTDVQMVKPGESVDVVASAEDAFVVTNMTLFYKQANEDAFNEVDLNRDSADRLFRHTIKTDATGGDLEYYFVASNGFKDTQTDTTTVTIEIDSTPNKPSDQKPENHATDVEENPTLSVKVSDKLGEALDVVFYKGKSFNTSKTDQVKIYENATDVEPPAERVPEGETELSVEDYEKLSALNGEKVSLDSDEQFPYQRFEVTLDEASLQQDEVEAMWYGSSLSGRKVSMYAWNLGTEVWDLVDHVVADSEETFTLSGDVSVADYVDGQTLNILVQDEIELHADNSALDIGDEPDFADFDFNFVWLADTQFYTEVFPWHFENQVNWIVDNKDNFNIGYVFHSGDIVNTWNQIYQWEYADQYMKVLEDANVPYGILAGNHDVELPQMDYTNYYKYFGEDRYADMPHYGGSFQNNRGHYDLISVQGVDFIMVHMGWQPQDDGIAWMNDVLAAYPDRVAILNFHQYVDETKRTAMGDRIFEEVVVPNQNVQMVVNGHHFGANFMKSEVNDPDGSTRVVHELMGNFQDETEGGLGFLNMMSFDIDTNSMYITSFSPSYETDDYAHKEDEKYNFYDDTPYRIPIDLAPMTKNVSTDYFEVNTYAGEEIGSVEAVASGDKAEMVWSDLEEGTPYSWYVTVTNETGNTVTSDMSHFRTVPLEADILNEAPVIHAEDQTITQGDTFDPFANVTATDTEDGDLTNDIVLVMNKVVPNTPGSYEVTYKVTDSNDATTTKTITVTVKEKVEEEKPTDPTDPTDPEKPTDPEDPEKPTNPEKPGNNGDGNDSDDKDGEELPKTATNMYTWLYIGMLLIAAAGIVAIYRRKAVK